MTLDLSFKELVDAAANPNVATWQPLLVAIDCIDEDPRSTTPQLQRTGTGGAFTIDWRTWSAATHHASPFQ